MLAQEAVTLPEVTTMTQVCITCKYKNFVKNGFDRKKRQILKCKNCGKRFTSESSSKFKGMRYPDRVILYALKLVFRFRMSLRKAKELLEDMGIEVSHVSIYNWIMKFAPYIEKILRKRKIQYSHTWHADEIYTKIKNKPGWLFVVIDNNSEPIAMYFSRKRDTYSAKKVFRKAVRRAGFKPNIIITDGLQAYRRAVKKVFGRRTKHIIAHFGKEVRIKRDVVKFSNNRIEGYNSWFRSWFHMKRGFKRVVTARKTLKCLVAFQNFADLLTPVRKECATISYVHVHREIKVQLVLPDLGLKEAIEC